MRLHYKKTQIVRLYKMPKQKLFLKAVSIALVINFAMFLIEIGFGFYANSLALMLDATDFLGDSLNYGIAIFVLSKTIKHLCKQ